MDIKDSEERIEAFISTREELDKWKKEIGLYPRTNQDSSKNMNYYRRNNVVGKVRTFTDACKEFNAVTIEVFKQKFMQRLNDKLRTLGKIMIIK